MTAAQPGSDDELGPVDFLAIEFSGGRLTAPGFEQLLSLAERGVVQILDMEFIAKDTDGTSKKVDVWDFAVPEGVDLSAWAGASSGLLDDSDPNPRVKRPAVIHSRVDDLEDSFRAGGHDKSPVLAPGPRVRGLSADPGPGPGLGRGAGDGAGGRG
jgi:Family of unknown function (DUF6325)